MQKYIRNNVFKTVAILKANQPFHGVPLKITKRTHFAVTHNIDMAYKEFFVFRCG